MSIITGHIDRLRGFEFWREGCHTFAKNVGAVLELALKDWDKDDLLQFLETLPRNRCERASEEWQKGFCSRCLEKVHQCREQEVAREALDYFITYFTDRHYDAQSMLINSLIGIISGVEAMQKEFEKEVDCASIDS